MAGKPPTGARPSPAAGSRPPTAGGSTKKKAPASTAGAAAAPGTPPAPPATGTPAETPKSPDRGGGTGSGRSASPSSVRLPASAGSAIESGAGFLLGLIAWGWVVMPLLTGGVGGMKKVLMAKFFNKAADGTWLA